MKYAQLVSQYGLTEVDFTPKGNRFIGTTRDKHVLVGRITPEGVVVTHDVTRHILQIKPYTSVLKYRIAGDGNRFVAWTASAWMWCEFNIDRGTAVCHVNNAVKVMEIAAVAFDRRTVFAHTPMGLFFEATAFITNYGGESYGVFPNNTPFKRDHVRVAHGSQVRMEAYKPHYEQACMSGSGEVAAVLCRAHPGKPEYKITVLHNCGGEIQTLPDLKVTIPHGEKAMLCIDHFGNKLALVLVKEVNSGQTVTIRQWKIKGNKIFQIGESSISFMGGHPMEFAKVFFSKGEVCCHAFPNPTSTPNVLKLT